FYLSKTRIPFCLLELGFKISFPRVARPGCTAVHITILAVHPKTRRFIYSPSSILHGQAHGRAHLDCARASSRTNPHGQVCMLHGRAVLCFARASS
ncbi:unnamed protein product, partial [Linum tenue]